MSDATFWFDGKIDDFEASIGTAANGIPARVIEGLAGKIPPGGTKEDRTRPTLWEMWCKDGLKHVEFKSSFALFIRGTTEDIVKAIKKDRAKGIGYLSIIGDDCLDIRYIRQNVSVSKSVSIVGIAGKDTYWAPMKAYQLDEARRLKTWAQMAVRENKETYTHKNHNVVVFSCISLGDTDLVGVIEKGRGVEHWF